ncbi:hypothetical protein HYALB_00006748 [Hymenoscyphus albidus]|uniref:Gag-like protein n=1 Tax=Hymenoscyphus albidus TaxID=595503 RepID=A0A9N9LTE1_9HELO|nr:hypothetical protein HYALB_00006748 [Hymenoscyphus albidus]
MSHPETSDDAIVASRSLLCKAIELEDNQPKKLALIDLLNLFRDYTEGKPLENTITTLTNSVNNLEDIAKRLPKTSYASVTANNQPTIDNSTQSLIDAQLNHTPPQKTDQQKNRDARKKANKERKEAIKAQRLILIEDYLQPFGGDLQLLTLQDAINKVFKTRFNISPVISTISRSQSNNLVLTAVEEYNAQFLLDRIEAIKGIIKFKEARVDTTRYQVVIHGIPIREFNSPTGLVQLKDEILTFNKTLNLQIDETPHWLTSKDKRDSGLQHQGSIVVAFKEESQAIRAQRNRLNLAGISARVEHLRNKSRKPRCSRCQENGHPLKYCKNPPKCKFCSQQHQSSQHKCQECQTQGEACEHTTTNSIIESQ